MQRLSILLMVIFLICGGRTATAQRDPLNIATPAEKLDSVPAVDTALMTGDSLHSLLPVKVYSRSPQSKDKLICVLQCINPVQIITRENPGWQDGLSVADAIRFFSGTQLKDYGGVGGLKTIDVRSMGTNHTAIMLDGVPLDNVQNGQVDLGKYALDNLSSISLYNNQNSQVFQPARAFASSASIYLTSRMPALDSSHPQVARLTLKTGSFGLWSPSAYYATRLSGIWRMRVNGSALFSQGDYPFTYSNSVYDTTLHRENGDVQSYHAGLGLEGDFKDSSQLSLSIYGFRRQMGLPGAIVSNRFTNQERQDENNYFIQANYLRPIGKRDQLKLLFKYNYDYLRYSNPGIQKLYITEADTLQGPLTNHYRQRSFYGSLANMYAITAFWRADFSADLTYDRLQTDLYGFPRPSRWTAYLAAASQLELGQWQVAGNILSTMVRDRVEAGPGAPDKNEWTPSLSLSWKPFMHSDLKIRGFYKRIFRMPTFNDLYYTQLGETNLKPEYTTQYDLGATYIKSLQGIWQSVLLQADVYYNQVRNKIVAIPTTSLFRWQMANLGLVHIKGLDLTAKTALAFHDWQLTAGLQYTYQKAEDYTDAQTLTYKNQLPYIPVHSGSLVLDAAYRKFSLKYSFLYDGERYSQSYNSLVNYVPAWYTHDLAVLYKCRINKNQQAIILLSVDNLLDQDYDVIVNYPMPGRNFKIGVTLQL